MYVTFVDNNKEDVYTSILTSIHRTVKQETYQQGNVHFDHDLLAENRGCLRFTLICCIVLIIGITESYLLTGTLSQNVILTIRCIEILVCIAVVGGGIRFANSMRRKTEKKLAGFSSQSRLSLRNIKLSPNSKLQARFQRNAKNGYSTSKPLGLEYQLVCYEITRTIQGTDLMYDKEVVWRSPLGNHIEGGRSKSVVKFEINIPADIPLSTPIQYIDNAVTFVAFDHRPKPTQTYIIWMLELYEPSLNVGSYAPVIVTTAQYESSFTKEMVIKADRRDSSVPRDSNFQ